MSFAGARSSVAARQDVEFSAAYGRYLAPLRAQCRRLLRSAEADDIAHEAFARLWEAKPVFPPSEDTRAILAWRYRTSTRLAIDVLRSRKGKEPVDVTLEALDALPCGPAPQDAIEARQIIRRLVEHIP